MYMFVYKYKTSSDWITHSCGQLLLKVFGCIIINLELILCRCKVSRGRRPSIIHSISSYQLIVSSPAGHDYVIYETI